MQQCGSADPGPQQSGQLTGEGRVRAGQIIGVLQLEQCGHESLGNVSAPEFSESAVFIRKIPGTKGISLDPVTDDHPALTISVPESAAKSLYARRELRVTSRQRIS
ncbi:hypothetical protein GCM10011588_38640 [Nocardia jinanensis]|uniref:Uncharacterized protein n=1 Tax=Nocardia jinanensis TaxID=382504 RepID=A0A917VVY8_9NOCA|nr:hypothetical protein GCM10011588_38640 [Nocardia jinanensis]